MRPARTALFALSITALTLGACEESTTAPPPAQNPGGGAQSQLGKSVEMGKDLRDKIEARDMSAGALADSISGGDGVVQIGNLSIPIPTDWTKVSPSNPMRLAQFEAEGGEVTVALSQAGGSVEDNISRWKGQVKDQGSPVEPAIDEMTVAGFPVTVVELTGDYTEGTMMGAGTTYNDYTMVGAILETGPTKTFIKMTGPFSLVSDQRANFESMLRGIQKN